MIYDVSSSSRAPVGPKIVAVGGGTGLSTMLRGLKKYTDRLTAIVTVADDGGGSGMLRRDIGMLPPGDIRHCMESLANTEPVMQQLLTYRFESGTLRGQCFGNLLLAALNGVTGSFDEAVHGCKKNITITRQQECTECHGSGCAAGSSPETCPDCGGRGYVIRQQRTPFGVMQTQQPCSRCGGKGKLVKNPCKVCHGSGKTATKKTLEVSIPMGIDDDQSFALRGMGDAGTNGGPAGDVIVMVTVRPSEVFQRDGYDVWVTVPITYSQAVLGDSITVPSIDGKVEYTVPEGTQSGTTFRLRGKGIQYLNGRGRGDMYVKCEVEIPKKLNKAQRDALKKFEGTLKEENYEKRKGFFKKLKDMFA